MKFLYLISTIFLLIIGLLYDNHASAVGSSSLESFVRISVCGNGILEGSEQCDGNDLGQATCTSLNLGDGNLSCRINCEFNTESCATSQPPTSRPIVEEKKTGVILSGYTSALSDLFILKDGQTIKEQKIGDDGRFRFELTDISAGSYIFGVYVRDSGGLRSPIRNVPLVLTDGMITHAENIFIAPTLSADKLEVTRGGMINFFGSSFPSALIKFYITPLDSFSASLNSNFLGAYSYNFQTENLAFGNYTVRSQAFLNNELSSLSAPFSFNLGERTVELENQPVLDIADLNGDGKVNLIDFSIIVYWYQRSNPPVHVDLNDDGVVDLADFSILAYYWTG